MHIRSLSLSLALYHYRLYAFCRLLFVGLKLFFFFDKESAFKKNYHMWEKDEEEASVSINSSVSLLFVFFLFFFLLFLPKPKKRRANTRSFALLSRSFTCSIGVYFFIFFPTKRHLARYQLKYRFFETLSSLFSPLFFPFFSLSPDNVSDSYFFFFLFLRAETRTLLQPLLQLACPALSSPVN